MALGKQGFYNILDHYHPEAKDWVVVNWNLGNMCNFKCSYCPSILHDGSYGWNEYDTVKKFIDKVTESYSPRKVYFEFTGGEVTLWKDFIKTAKYIKECGHDVGFISNASRTIRWWEKNKTLFDHVCLSFHPEFSDPNHFIEVVKIMSEQCRTHTNIMMHNDPDKWVVCKDVADRVVAEIPNISLALQPLVIDFGNERFPYTKEQEDFFQREFDDYYSKIVRDDRAKKFKLYRGSMLMKDTVNNIKEAKAVHLFIADNTNNWKGWDCWAGVENIAVDFDGSVWRGWCRVGGKMGFIQYPEHLQFPDSPVRCNKNYCHCNFDIMSKKVLPENRYEVIEDENE